jgi:hypothetical protein
MAQIELTEKEAELSAMGMALLLTFMQEQLNKHKNHKDYSMDKLFALMEMYATTGDLWVRYQMVTGLTREEISQYISEQEG